MKLTQGGDALIFPSGDRRLLNPQLTGGFGLRAEKLDYLVVGHFPPIIGTPNGKSIAAANAEGVTIARMIYDGKKIASARIAKEWSMARLAREAKLSQPSLWALEHQVTKKPRFETLTSIARALGVPVQAILHAKPGLPESELTETYHLLTPQNKTALHGVAQALLKSQK